MIWENQKAKLCDLALQALGPLAAGTVHVTSRHRRESASLINPFKSILCLVTIYHLQSFTSSLCCFTNNVAKHAQRPIPSGSMTVPIHGLIHSLSFQR
jgi:hypothetical protein